VLASQYREVQARFSPDGKWLAYVSDESGRPEVYVQPYPALDQRVPVSTDGGAEPVWSPDGRRLYFRSEKHVMVATFTATSPPEFSVPRMLFTDRFVRTQGENHTHYDVAPDGRLLMLEDPAGLANRPPGEMVVVLNWAEELKRLVPAK
jgi:Tol biopolymer transport system component